MLFVHWLQGQRLGATLCPRCHRSPELGPEIWPGIRPGASGLGCQSSSFALSISMEVLVGLFGGWEGMLGSSLRRWQGVSVWAFKGGMVWGEYLGGSL